MTAIFYCRHSLISTGRYWLLVVIDSELLFRRLQWGAPPPGADPKAASALPLPILSGYEIGQRILASGSDFSTPERVVPEPMPKALLPSANRHAPSHRMPSMEQVIDQKKRKRIFAEGTELFNQSPKKGIEYLREKGLLDADAKSVVNWLRTNPQLDKKKIADYICSRKHADVLEAFVQSFPFENTRLDDALRMFLETFRLPGEAAEINQWYKANHEPFNHVDAAFTLSYAIIMLNTDQHNPTVRRNQPPMTVDCFKRNLSGTNGGADFDPEMLMTMYNAIKSEEIVMPAEQTGIVKENYLWKVLKLDLIHYKTMCYCDVENRLKVIFEHAPTGWNDHDLFSITWGPAVAALTYVFDKSEHDVILQKALNGFRKCASIAAHYGMKDVFDNLIIHLCKFSTLASNSEGHGDDNLEMQRQRNMNEVTPGVQHERIAVAFGENRKAQMATKTMFELVHASGDILREGWRNLLDCLLQLFRARLLPPELTEVDDFVDEKGWVSLIREHVVDPQPVRSESGLLSWFGLGGGASEAERKKINTGAAKRHQGSSFVSVAQWFVDIWSGYCRPRFGRSPLLVERAVVGLLRIANRNLFRDNTVADDVLQSLSLLLPEGPASDERQAFSDGETMSTRPQTDDRGYTSDDPKRADTFRRAVTRLPMQIAARFPLSKSRESNSFGPHEDARRATEDALRYAAGPLSGDAQNRLTEATLTTA
ncbi:Sec7 domain protein [Ostertagia ostertagi]